MELAREMNRRRLEKNYQLSPARLAGLLRDQNYQCAICSKSFHGVSKRERHIDHDHHHGTKVRGILCHHCNALIGFARDDVGILQAAVTYLQKHCEKPIENAIYL